MQIHARVENRSRAINNPGMMGNPFVSALNFPMNALKSALEVLMG